MLSDEVMEHQFVEGFKPVNIEAYNRITDPAVLEAIACRKALALAEDLSLQSFMVACDCKPVVDDIHDGKGGAHLTVIREIRLRSSNSFIF